MFRRYRQGVFLRLMSSTRSRTVYSCLLVCLVIFISGNLFNYLEAYTSFSARHKNTTNPPPFDCKVFFRDMSPASPRWNSTSTGLFKQAQICLKDSPFVPEDMPLVLRPGFAPNVDIRAHYIEMLRITQPLRSAPIHTYTGYEGPWIENYWIDRFCCDRDINEFGGLVPLFIAWTDLTIQGDWFLTSAGIQFLRTLRRDVIYVTVSQHDDGINSGPRSCFPAWESWNILVLSSGGFGHIPLPLLIGKTLDYQKRSSQPKHLVVFAGSFHDFCCHIRKTMKKIVTSVSEHLNFNFEWYFGPDWIRVFQDSLLVLSPRGWGRTSFRLAEVIQLGLTPVHLWDDDEWIPYRSTDADFRNFGYSVHIDRFEEWLYDVVLGLEKNPDFLHLDEKHERLMRVKASHYTFEGVIHQIELFFKNDIGNLSDLRCQRHPQVNNRMRFSRGYPLD